MKTLVVGTAAALADSVVATLPQAARLAGADAGQTSALLVAQLGAAVPARVVVVTPATAISGLLSAKGAPVIVVTGALPALTAKYLQRGVASVASPAGTTASYIWAARRA